MCSSPTQKSNIPSSISIDPLLLCPLTFSVCNFMNTVTKLYHPTKLNKTLLILPNNHLVLRTCTKCTASTVPLERTLAQSGPAMRLPATPSPFPKSINTRWRAVPSPQSVNTHTLLPWQHSWGSASPPGGWSGGAGPGRTCGSCCHSRRRAASPPHCPLGHRRHTCTPRCGTAAGASNASTCTVEPLLMDNQDTSILVICMA